MIPTDFAKLVQHAETSGKRSLSQIAEQLGIPVPKLIDLTSSEFPSDALAMQIFKIAKVMPSDNVDWSLFVQTKQNATAWYKFVSPLVDSLEEASALSDMLRESPGTFMSDLVLMLKDVGLDFKPQPPQSSWRSTENTPTVTSPIKSLLISIIRNWHLMVELLDWAFHDLYVEENQKQVEKAMELYYLLPRLSLAHLDEDLIVGIGIDNNLLAEAIAKAQAEATELIDRIYEIGKTVKQTIYINYFDLLYVTPEELEYDSPRIKMPFSQQPVLQHLSLAERSTLSLLEQLIGTLIGRRPSSGDRKSTNL